MEARDLISKRMEIMEIKYKEGKWMGKKLRQINRKATKQVVTKVVCKANKFESS